VPDGHRRQYRPGLHNWWILFGGFGLLAGLVWARTDQSVQTCKSVIVGALDQGQCSTVTFWHDVAGIATIILAVLFVAGLVSRGRQS
jgi:hypothetical protein